MKTILEATISVCHHVKASFDTIQLSGPCDGYMQSLLHEDLYVALDTETGYQ